MDVSLSKKVSNTLLKIVMSLALFASVCLLPANASATPPPPSKDVYYREISGPDRYATAVKALDEMVYPDFTGMIIATGEAYPDTLSASSLAGLMKYPVLLNPSDRIPDVVMDCVKKHKPDHIIIIGSEAAISASVEDSFRNLSFVGNVERIGGVNRYETSKAIYEYGKNVGKGWTSDTAILATGENFADGISVANYATSTSSPLLLVDRTTTIDKTTQSALSLHERVLLIGDSTRISEATEKSLYGLGSITKVVRLAGSNRYETNLKVHDFQIDDEDQIPGLPSFNLDYYIASGTKFPDALTIGISCALKRGRTSIYLADDTPAGKSFLRNFDGDPTYGYRIYFIGTQAATTAGLREATIKGIGGNPHIEYPLQNPSLDG